MKICQIKYLGIYIVLLGLMATGCKKLAGLKLQQNQDHIVHTLDPHLNKTAWQYLKDRSIGNNPDTIFKRMYDAIIYSGIDTSEYTQADRTFIFMHNDAVYRLASNKVTTDCFFGRYLVNGKPAKRWEDYPASFVKNYLLYLIVKGKYSFDNVTPDNVEVKTLLPEGADPLNPASIMAFRVVNDRNSKFRINDFPGTVPYTTQRWVDVRTAGLLSTNGPIHVVDRVVEYRIQ